MPPSHWSKIPQKNSLLPLPFTLHLKIPTQVSGLAADPFEMVLLPLGMISGESIPVSLSKMKMGGELKLFQRQIIHSQNDKKLNIFVLDVST